MAIFNYATAARFLRSSASTITTQNVGCIFLSSRSSTINVSTRKHPLGAIFTQLPQNGPIALTLRATTIPILFGNTVVFRPSKLSPQIVYDEEDTPTFTAEIIVDAQARKVAFTGSDRVGKIIALECPKHLKCKPCVLELGWTAHAIVLDDAPVSLAVKQIPIGAAMHIEQMESYRAERGALEEFTEELLEAARESRDKGTM
ncbi:hypothetical protein PQX77_021031 [Marasmius sp. AFHP31]|nr:hypothetical protein PQX77_021031 [Marasmius sp. AFHP31]